MTNSVKMWRKQRKVRNLLGQKGKVLTWTKVFVSPPEYKDFAPYPVVLVELESGVKTYGQLVDYDELNLKIGQEVTSILRIAKHSSPEEIMDYGLKFKPLE